MAHTKVSQQSSRSKTESHRLSTTRQNTLSKPDVSLFYELEAAVVIDVIRDENHLFKNKTQRLRGQLGPTGYNDPSTPDYS